MRGFLQLVLIIILGAMAYQGIGGSWSVGFSSDDCSAKHNQKTKKCLKEKYADERYIVSEQEFEEEIKPYMERVVNSHRSGFYHKTTSSGEKVSFKVSVKKTKGSYCPRKKRHLYNKSVSYNTMKPIAISSD